MEKFDPLEHPICLSLPRRRVPFLSWRQHVPFAMLLVDILKPRILVELGVHYGDSYCAFCQAVDELRLNTACYGVDTWKGDPHAGVYGSEVLADLVTHHDHLYGAFSHLIQSTFEEARQHFSNGTIDILHIDGYHTYKAVKHDFEMWLPKMSPRGVILLHDINEKRQDFGAWKVWDEVKVRYPHFDFLHCHGLGIVAVGQRPPEELSWLFEASEERAAVIRNFFFCLGDRLTDKMTLVAKPEAGATVEPDLGALLAARAELESIRSSITWRLARKLHSFIDAMLPIGTRRRSFTGWLLSRNIAMLESATKRRNQHSNTEPPNNRKELVCKHIRGVGVAVGSLPPHLKVPANVVIDYAYGSDFEASAGDHSAAPWDRLAGASTQARIASLTEASDESYDFVICNQLYGDMPNPAETVKSWLRVLKPGGIIYLAVPDDDVSPKVISNLQFGGSSIRVIDNTTIPTDTSKQSIYIIEKSNYIPRIIENLEKNPRKTSSDGEYLVDVVVPIYNAYEELERCLYSLFKYQDIYRINLIDDCSKDIRVKQLLNTLKRHHCERFKIVENEENVGYTKIANKGMRMVSGDVILLNSDTIVTSRWVQKMRTCAYSRDQIATVTPFTNNGTECSIPEFGQNNEIPEGFTVDSFAELVENSSVKRYPELVTAIGFCIYIRRAIIDEIGYFDEENFGKGYGEENDFSMRAMCKGYNNVLCDNTFVFHRGAASFGQARDANLVTAHLTLEKMYPEFWPTLRQFHQMNPLKELQDNVKRAMKTWNTQAGRTVRHQKRAGRTVSDKDMA